MNENAPPDSSPTRKHQRRSRVAIAGHSPTLSDFNAKSCPSTPDPTALEGSSSRKKQKRYRNGYEVSPKTPSFLPYTLEKRGRQRVKPFTFADESPSKRPRQVKKLSEDDWNALAREAGAIPSDASLRDFQMQCASHVLKRGGDACIIAPTGAGKSMLWCLPLLASPCSVSLVVTPYTSLGTQGESDMRRVGLSSIFINADQNTDTDLEKVARGHYRAVFICAESLETPRFARVLHSALFQKALQAIYIDEAHLVKESLEWRPSYGRLGQLRTIVGKGIPLIAISATLPSSYRDSLCTHAGLRTNYLLVNLGNFRSELSLVVRPLRYEGSFHDLAFTLPISAIQEVIPSTLVYHDNINKLTAMFWWYHSRLHDMKLSTSLVDIIHSGLSDAHQQRVLDDFRKGHTAILLATEKIGAGVHLPRVERVIQYLAGNNLSLAKLDQRRGRGARTKGMTAICYFLVEPDLTSDDLKEIQRSVDPGILALVKANGCYQDVLDRFLENPLRPRPLTLTDATRLCCSHCHPHLASFQEYQWIMIDSQQLAKSSTHTLSKADQELILTELRRLRLAAWHEQWQAEWPCFGPRTLITDADLEAVAKVATSITSLDDLRPLTRIPYWNDFAPWLLLAVKASVSKLGLRQQSTGASVGSIVEESEEISAHQSVEQAIAASRSAQASGRANPRTAMHHAESIIDFST